MRIKTIRTATSIFGLIGLAALTSLPSAALAQATGTGTPLTGSDDQATQPGSSTSSPGVDSRSAGAGPCTRTRTA